jgi:hypothetical protein
LLGVQFAVAVAGQDAGVQLLAEAQLDGVAVAVITVEAGIGGGLADRVAQFLGGDIDAGCAARSSAPSRRTMAWKCTSPRA